MLRLAFCTVLSDIPASAAAFTMSSLASSFPSASSSSISLSACSVLVAVLPPAPDSIGGEGNKPGDGKKPGDVIAKTGASTMGVVFAALAMVAGAVVTLEAKRKSNR